MRILFTSDLHGYEQAFRDFARMITRGHYDCGVIAGDLMTHFTPKETERILHENGLSQDDLVPELESADGKSNTNNVVDEAFALALRRRASELQSILAATRVPIFFVMGNDDGIVGGGYQWPSTESVQNINQRRIEFGQWNFVGYQYTSPFVGGMFERSELEQEADLRSLEVLVDSKSILVTHGPPRGVLDGDDYGSLPLLRLVSRVPPALHLFGHIHQSAGIQWPHINGSFPNLRRFISIDVISKSAGYLSATDSL